MNRSRRAVLRVAALAGSIGVAGCHDEAEPTESQNPGNGDGNGGGNGGGTDTQTTVPSDESDESEETSDETEEPTDVPVGSSEEWRTYQVDLPNTGAVPLQHGQFYDSERNWTETLGETGPTQPVFDRDGLFVATRGAVYAFDRESRDRRWRFETSENGPATPALDDRGFVYVATEDEVVKLHGEEGWSAWEFNFTSEFPNLIGVTAKSAPVLVGGTVVLNLVLKKTSGSPSPASRVIGIDASSGSLRWQFEPSRQATVPPTVYAPAPAVAGNTLYVTAGHDKQDAALYALNSGNGNKRWAKSYKGKGWSSATVANGLVYIADRYIQVFDTGGNHRTRRTVDPPPNAYAVAAGSEYVFMSSRTYGGNEGRLFAVNDRGKVEWTFEGEGNLYVPTVTSDTVYVASGSGSLFSLDQSDGLVNWRHDLGLSGVVRAAGPAVRTDEIYLAAASKTEPVELYSISPT